MRLRDWVRVLVAVSKASPLFGLGVVTLILALVLWIARVTYTVVSYSQPEIVAVVRADEDFYEDENGVLLPCPGMCKAIHYESFWWYASCWPLPRVCSADPYPFTLQSITSPIDPSNASVIPAERVTSPARIK